LCFQQAGDGKKDFRAASRDSTLICHSLAKFFCIRCIAEAKTFHFDRTSGGIV